MHAVQRFANLALSTLRLVFVAKQCGVTEPGKGKKQLVRNASTKPPPAAQCCESCGYECFLTLLLLSNSFSLQRNEFNKYTQINGND